MFCTVAPMPVASARKVSVPLGKLMPAEPPAEAEKSPAAAARWSPVAVPAATAQFTVRSAVGVALSVTGKFTVRASPMLAGAAMVMLMLSLSVIATVAVSLTATCMLESRTIWVADKVTVKDSLISAKLSSTMGRLMVAVWENIPLSSWTPLGKLTVPLGNLSPVKSAVVAWVAPVPLVVTAHMISMSVPRAMLAVRVTVMFAAPSSTVTSATSMVCAASMKLTVTIALSSPMVPLTATAPPPAAAVGPTTTGGPASAAVRVTVRVWVDAIRPSIAS